MNIRIGYGYDVHRLEKGYPLYLGGIKLESEKGAVGHSDADVLIHAICDAILGAAGMRDIGFHFPNTDPKYKGIDSKELLREVMEKIEAADYEIGNIDASLVIEAPKINPYIDAMKSVLAKILHVTTAEVGIKATTSESLGFVGQGLGVQAHAVALLFRNS